MIALALLAILTAAPAAIAQDPVTGRTYVTLTAPARVPGATLEPDAYVFVPGRAVAGQMVVDVFRAGDMESMVSVLAVESDVPRPERGSFVDYAGPPPPAMRAWFPPGLRHGYEFVYAPDEAARIFSASGESVPSARFRGSASQVGLLPIDHVDAAYRGGRPDDPRVVSSAAAALPGPMDQLTLARIEILVHLHQMPADVATRLTLINRQLARLMTSYVDGRADVPEQLSIVQAAVETALDTHLHASFGLHADPETTHVLQRVRERLALFARALRWRGR